MPAASERGAPTRRACAIVAAIAAAATAYPPLLALARDGLAGAFPFLAGDSFYYFEIASRSVDFAGFTYDGEHATNGFHPLWGWALTFAYGALDAAREAQVALAFGASIALCAFGAAAFALAVLRATARPALAILAVVPGLYAFAVPAFNPHYGSIWSFVNGMESPLSLALCGALVLAAQSGARGARLDERLARPAIAVLASAVVLARLDDALLVAAAALLAVATRGSARERLARAIRVSIVPALFVLAYLAYNLSYSGMAMPVSGAAKLGGGPPALLRNGYAALTTLLPFVDPLGRGAVLWGEQAYRIAQMLVPCAVALVWLARERRAAHAAVDARTREIASWLSLYVLLKGGYGFAAVHLWNQGQWYYPLSIYAANAIGAIWIGQILERSGARTSFGRATALTSLVALLFANAYAALKRDSGVHAGYYAFWSRANEIERELEARCPGCGVLELDDGIIAHALSRRVLSGSGLALDAEGDAARRRGELLALARSRGHSLLATVGYPLDLADGATASDALRAAYGRVSFLKSQRLDGYEFELVYRDAATGVRFVRFTPLPR